MYFLGMVLCDAACGGFKNPLAGIENDLYVERILKEERPKLPQSDGSGIVQLITFCWSSDPEVRPNSTQVLERLEEMYDST